MPLLQITAFSANLFWDADPSDLDPTQHKPYVMRRVLEYGTLADWHCLRDSYGLADIVATAQTMRTLDPKALSFLVALGAVTEESFRCSTQTQSIQSHWIY